jgi:hypothetical protein
MEPAYCFAVICTVKPILYINTTRNYLADFIKILSAHLATCLSVYEIDILCNTHLCVEQYTFTRHHNNREG